MAHSIAERFAAALHSTARGWRGGLDRRLKFLGLGHAGGATIAVVTVQLEP